MFIDTKKVVPNNTSSILRFMPQTRELAQFDSIKSDHKRAHKVWEKARLKAASVFS